MYNVRADVRGAYPGVKELNLGTVNGKDVAATFGVHASIPYMPLVPV